MIKTNTGKFVKLFLLNAIITFVLFYLFEEEKAVVFELGTKCSNQFIIRCSVQTVVMTLVFYFSSKLGKKGKKV